MTDENKRSTFMAVANSLKLSRGNEAGWPPVNAEQAVANLTFDCVLHFETQLPTGNLKCTLVSLKS